MTYNRLFVLIVFSAVGIIFSGHAGCGASRPLREGMVQSGPVGGSLRESLARSRSTDTIAERQAYQNEQAKWRIISRVAGQLMFYLDVRQHRRFDVLDAAEISLAEAGASIMQHHIDVQTTRTLVNRGVGEFGALALVEHAKREAHSVSVSQVHSSEGMQDRMV